MGPPDQPVPPLGLGHFRDLLVGISRDPAMLFWLDNWLNTATLPQENYGARSSSCFSMGVDAGYTENDVRAMARCFTGWTTTTSQGNQFGTTTRSTTTGQDGARHVIQNPQPNGERDAYDAIDVILSRPQTARYVVGKMVEWFCQQSPDSGLVQELADHWVNSGHSTRAVFDVLLRSRWFYSSYARRTLVKSPIEHMVGAMRQLGIDNVRYGGITPQRAARQSQRPGLSACSSWASTCSTTTTRAGSRKGPPGSTRCTWSSAATRS
jgi:uncharacterized protein (DUF1800 family)